MFFRMVFKSGQIFLPFCHNTRVWQTDRQTDGQTDGRTEFLSQYRVCITCSAVIKGASHPYQEPTTGLWTVVRFRGACPF